MHTSLNRRVRALSTRSLGAIVLAATMVSGTSSATAEQAPLGKADATSGVRAHATQLEAHRSASPAVAGPQGCITRKYSADREMLRSRYAGADRYTTSVCVSYGTWWNHSEPREDVLKADAVVLARGDDFPDALAGGPLAAYVNGPLLLTTPNGLRPEVKAEIQRVLAPKGTVFLLGGTGSLSAGVNSAITAMGYRTERIAGADRFQTAIRIAERMPTTNLFFVTTGMDFPDALAAGAVAARNTYYATHTPDTPVGKPTALLFTQDSTMPDSTGRFAETRAHEHGMKLLMMTAGGAADQAVRSSFPPAVIESYVGADRFDTAAVIARHFHTDTHSGKLTASGIGLANGMNFPDALAGTALLMHPFGNPLLLTHPTRLDIATRLFLQNHQARSGEEVNLHVFGGTAVVSDGVADAALNVYDPPD